MITIEISPDAVSPESGSMLNMSTELLENGWNKTVVQTADNDKIIGWAKQKQNPEHLVRFYQGKGGFCAVVSSSQLTYFSLPGSRLVLPDTEVELPGELIPGKLSSFIRPLSHTATQTVTSQAMILGAGLATRFEPISGDTTGYPKPAVPVLGEDSVIVTIAKHLRKHGFFRIVVNTFYMPDCLKRQLSSVSDLDICYLDEEVPSGTAGGLLKALQKGLINTTQPLFIIQGDAITDADLSFLLDSHKQHNAAVTIGGQIVPDQDISKFGIIETDGSGSEDGQSGNIISFKEKPSLAEAGKSRFANAGFYVLAPEIFDLFVEVGNRCFVGNRLYDYAKDFFPEVLEAIDRRKIVNSKTEEPMRFRAEATSGYWSDIGNPYQYIEAVRDIYEGRLEWELPSDIKEYYDNDIIYWPGAKSKAEKEVIELKGNIIITTRS